VKDPSTADRWRVRQIPTVIVLENGREVDRIVGSLESAELKRRLTGNVILHPANDSTGNASSKLAKPVANAFLGPNHPQNDSNFGPNHPLYKSNLASAPNHSNKTVSSREDNFTSSLGVNHPYYSLYNKPRIASDDPASSTSQRSRATRRPTNLPQLPESPESLAATVRIRVKYEANESVGTGTIIDIVDNEALVLTCGHLFRHSEGQRPMTVEIFEEGEAIPLPAILFDFRNDEVDLGLVKFQMPCAVSKVPILPKGEKLHEQDSVFSIGCDGGEGPSRSDSVITKLNRFLGPSNVEIAGAPVQGRSGGGLFDARGRLIGVCIAADNDLDEGLFVGPDAIYAQLEKHRLNRLFEDSK
jgi:S1-C subfamily serine protease